MNNRIKSFEKRKDFLILVDSDGCVMDTMVVKHRLCFGPCLVKEWSLEPWRDEVLAEWNQLNLFTGMRGCNRFEALAVILREIDRSITHINGVDVLEQWVRTTPDRSNQTLREAVEELGHTILCMALAWSEAVNQAVDSLTMEDKLPFANVGEGLIAAHRMADVVVLSGGNSQAIQAEWDAYGLSLDADLMLTQEDGDRQTCIRRLMEKGYASDHVLMISDDPGDVRAAKELGIHFYPIRVRWESEDWRSLYEQTLPLLQNGSYSVTESSLIQDFLTSLGM